MSTGSTARVRGSSLLNNIPTHSSLHTSPKCVISSSTMTGTIKTNTCDAKMNNNAGCGIQLSNASAPSIGLQLNQQNGGWYAMWRDVQGWVPVAPTATAGVRVLNQPATGLEVSTSGSGVEMSLGSRMRFVYASLNTECERGILINFISSERQFHW